MKSRRRSDVKMLTRYADARRLILTLLCAALSSGSRLVAQQPASEQSWCPAAENGGTRVWGTVFDSVSRQPLTPVIIQLQPLTENGEPMHSGWWAATDALGRFCFRGPIIRLGRYRLTATHRPVLGHRRPPSTHRDLRVESPEDSAVSVPYRSFDALDSIVLQQTRDSLLAMIRDHRQRWRAHRPPRYHYQAQPNCLCPNPLVTIVVEGDSAIGILDPKTGAERRASASDSLMTIDGLFDWLEADVRNPQNNLWSITWDARYGFPTRWEAGRDVILIDSYGGATITQFEPARR